MALLPAQPRPPEPETGVEPSPPAAPPTNPSPSPSPAPPPEEPEPGSGPGGGDNSSGDGGDSSGGGGGLDVPEEFADCGALEVSCHVTNWFYDLVVQSLEPLMGWLGSRAFHTPRPTGGMETLWQGVLEATSVLYVLAILAGGVAVLCHQSLQQRYSAREILPRLVVGFVAAHASLWICEEMIRGANGIAAGVAALGIDADRAAQRFNDRLSTLVVDATLFVILLLVALVVLLVVWCVIEAVRIVMAVTLVVAAPLLLAFHALPYTQRLASLWWRCMAGLLAVPIAQSLAFTAFMRVIFQGEVHVVEGGGQGLVTIALFLTLLYLQVRVPFWVFHLVWRPNVGSSPLASAARTAVMALVFRKVLPGRGSGGAAAGAMRRGGGGGGAGASGGGRRPPPRGPGPAGRAGSRGAAAKGTRASAAAGRSTTASGAPGSGSGERGAAAARGALRHPHPSGSHPSSPVRPPGAAARPTTGANRQGGSMPASEPEGRPVQLSLFPGPRRWRQGVLPTPPPARVSGNRSTQRWGDTPPARPEEPPRAGRGQQPLFPGPRPPTSARRPGPPRAAKPPPPPRRGTQRWGEVEGHDPQQEPRRPGRGQQSLFAAPQRRTPAASSSPEPEPDPAAPRRRPAPNPRDGPARPRPQAPRRTNRRKDDDQ
ncbi:hypothetical protein [Streptomonospora litoralis]|uniref:hypothetical protein n=1 Tax=Streptomonospora litoralis TaxID=2498135 RepID=UPI00103600C9|nr:hypothetical protein [Streptomonospora litoralis]